MTDLSISQYANDLVAPAEIVEEQQAKIGAEISIEQLHKYYGEVKVLEDLDLTLKQVNSLQLWDVVVVVKYPTAFNCRLEQPSYGEIKFKSLLNFREGIIADDIRVMFQDPRLLPWKSILKNVQLGLAKNQFSKAEQLLEKVGLKEKSGLWPSQLSGGQRQRTALARALSHTPRVLLLDEPLGALDALTRLEMQNLIEKLWLEQGFTTILVTHDVSEAVQLADRIILLDKGHIAQQFQVDLPRPRQKGVAFAELEQQVLSAVLAT